MKTPYLMLTTCSLFLILPTFSHAAPVTDSDFNKLDSNLDGRIAWDEYAARNPKSGRINPRLIFDNVDKNRDSYIDPAEFADMKQRRAIPHGI
ncbi:MAG: hypothetical protein ACK4RS_02585 [Thiothrix sp.]